ncbi:MAG: HDIG domain-containing metalloprotein [Candidatus Zixiibacteriota bacterium]
MNNQPWLKQLLSEGKVYEVGGPVRDHLFGLPLGKDRDYLVCGIPLDRLQSILRRHGSVNLVGKSFGVLKFTPEDPESSGTFDIALPRSERSTGTGHRDFAVDFDPNLPVEKDLLRRDFTINAIARDCATGELVDPYNGMQDIADRILRMVFPGAFRDDPLRILRGAQFVARFNLKVDPATHDAMAEAAPLVSTVSLERVAEELTKLLTLSDKPSVGFLLLQRLGVLRLLIPELEETVGVDQPGGYHAWPVFEHSLYTVDAAPRDLRVRLAALLHDINKPQCKEVDGEKATFYGHEKRGSKTARSLLRRLRFPHELADEVSLLVERHMFTTDVTDKGMRRLIRWLGPELVYDLLNLRRADVVAQGKGGTTEDVDELEARITNEINKKSPFGLKDLAVNGGDLMRELSLSPGPIIGRILNHLLEIVLDDPERNDAVILLDEARKYLSDNT